MLNWITEKAKENKVATGVAVAGTAVHMAYSMYNNPSSIVEKAIALGLTGTLWTAIGAGAEFASSKLFTPAAQAAAEEKKAKARGYVREEPPVLRKRNTKNK